jgi:hypothetical protein
MSVLLHKGILGFIRSWMVMVVKSVRERKELLLFLISATREKK